MADEFLRPDIQAARDQMEFTFGVKREIRRLVEHLHEGEQVHLMASGHYGSGEGLLVLTDRRLLFTHDAWTSKTTEDFPLSKISSVEWKSGLALGKLVVHASGNRAEITQVGKQDGRRIVGEIRARLAEPCVPVAPPASDQDGDVYDQLRKLGELRDLGIVTPAEFEAKKAELLSRI